MKSRLFKICVYSLSIVVFSFLAISTYLYFNKDDITKNLLLDINTYTTGELQIEEVEINPFIHFPQVSLTLNKPRYFEKKINENDTTNHQIFHFSRLNLVVDILELLKSHIEIVAISMEDGSIKIIQNMDSTFNISTLFYTSDSSNLVMDDHNLPLDTINNFNDISLSIRQFSISNIEVEVDLIPTNQKQTFRINQSKASFRYVTDSIQCKLSSSFTINRIGFNKNLSLEQEDLEIDMELFYDRNDEIIDIYDSKIAFRSAQLHADGSLDLKENGNVDVSFEVNDDELQFTKLFLTSEGINNIKEGGLFLNGKIHGSYRNKIPEVMCNFGVNKLKIQIPNSTENLYDIRIDGRFSSGTLADLSEAFIEIDTITALLPEGHLNGLARIKNLLTPEIYYNLDASLRLESLNNIFELGPFENLKGRVTLVDTYHGVIQKDGTLVGLDTDLFSLHLDSISFNLSEIMEVDLLNGSISGNPDSLNLEQLYLETQNSDFLLDGTLSNFTDFIYDRGKPIRADLFVISSQYDFPEFFSFLPKVAESFPYQIDDISLNVTCETSHEKLSDFKRIPELNFEIHDVSGRIKSLLPFAKMKGGTFTMSEIDSTSIYDFTDFEIEVEGYAVKANYTLYNIPEGLDSMVIGFNTKGINPSSIFYDANDTIPDIVNAEVQGDFICNIVLPEDSLTLFHAVRITADDVHYMGQDTLSAQQLLFQSNDIAFDKTSELNPLETLSATNSLQFTKLTTSVFQSESLDLGVDIADGKYIIIPDDHDQFGKNEQGKIILQPFEDPPKYHLQYTIEELPLDKFLESFNNEKLFSGEVDLDLDLFTFGNDIDEITSNMSGSINLVGDSLTLVGLNLDELINNFQRSQTFNLVDVTAVALAGPAGILYSKGSDYAILLTTKKGETTTISKISSKWNLDEGKISVDDLAFATLENRVAVNGWLNMKSDSLDLVVGVLNHKGCAIIDQRIYGSAGEPEYSKVKIIRTLLSPVTNVLKSVVGKECDIFYEGIVAHPVRKKEQ